MSDTPKVGTKISVEVSTDTVRGYETYPAASVVKVLGDRRLIVALDGVCPGRSRLFLVARQDQPYGSWHVCGRDLHAAAEAWNAAMLAYASL